MVGGARAVDMARAATLSGRSDNDAAPRAGRLGLALHGGAIGLTLLVCLALPRSGQDVLLVPLTPHAAAGRLAGAGLPPLAVMGRGPLAGSLIVRSARVLPLWPLLRSGILPFAVPLMACGREPAARAAPSLPIRGSHG